MPSNTIVMDGNPVLQLNRQDAEIKRLAVVGDETDVVHSSSIDVLHFLQMQS